MASQPPRRGFVRRSTPVGEHRPVMLSSVLDVLQPRSGQVVVDCTVGWGGHALELVSRIQPGGTFIGLDLDAENLPRTRERLDKTGFLFHLHHLNFAGLAQALGMSGHERADLILADLGFSSMQVDDPTRGFSYRRDGPLDMRLDRSRGRTAAQILASIPEEELAKQLRDLADEPEADAVARAIVVARAKSPFESTSQLAQFLIDRTGNSWQLHPQPGVWNIHPATRLFQALRILVNRELANLEHLMRILPQYLNPGGRAAIITFHSGEDRLVKAAFQQGKRAGVYDAVAEEPVRASFAEKQDNPRSRSAKLRWAVRAACVNL